MTWNPTNTKFDVTIAGSKWTTTGNEIYYSAGKVGIGLTNPSSSGAALQVTGTISLSSAASSAFFWSGVSDTFLGRANIAGTYSSSAAIGDLILSGGNKIIIKSGATANPIAMCIDTSNNVGIGKTNPVEKLDVTGNIVTSGNINLANTSRSLYWGGTSCNLGRAGVGGEYSTSSAINDIVLRSGSGKLLLQSGVGAAAMCVDLSNNVGIGKTNPSSNYRLDVSGNVNCSGIYVNGTQFTGSSTWTSVTGKPFTTLDTTTYSPTTTQTECEIIMYPRIVNVNTTLLSGKVWVDKPLKFTPASTSGGPITEYLPPYISLNINTNTLEIDSSGNLNVKSGGGGSSQWITSGTNIYYNSGNVGIGTTIITNNVKLDVRGNIESNSSIGTLNQFYFTGASNCGILRNLDINSSSYLVNDIILSTPQRIYLKSNNGTVANGVVVDTSNNVGIRKLPGYTVNNFGTVMTSYNFDIHGNSRMTGILDILANNTNTNPQMRMIKYTNANNEDLWSRQIYMYITSANDLIFAIDTYTNSGQAMEIHHKIAGTTVLLSSFYGVTINSSTASTWPLFVSNSRTANTTAATKRYINTISNVVSSTTSSIVTVANFAGSIWCSSGSVYISSDKRIKKNILDVDDDSALQMILKIEPKTYEYKDHFSRGTKRVYGFISQQIKEHLPEAVKEESGTLYDIYKVFKMNNNIIHININEYEGTYNIGDKLSYVLKDNAEGILTIKQIFDNYIVIDEIIDETDIFINGKIISDFHVLDKTYIYTLNVSATQELHRKITAKQEEINNLKNRLVALEEIILNKNL